MISNRNRIKGGFEKREKLLLARTLMNAIVFTNYEIEIHFLSFSINILYGGQKIEVIVDVKSGRQNFFRASELIYLVILTQAPYSYYQTFHEVFINLLLLVGSVNLFLFQIVFNNFSCNFSRLIYDI